MQLEAARLGVVRGGRRILDAASVALAAPGVVAVIGPNGAGKSTLLLALAGLLKPDEGVVTLDGAPVLDVDRRLLARRRAYLPQNARCEWPISVARVIALGLTPTLPAYGDLAPADAARVEEMLAHCDLAARRAQPVTTLSGGELARTMLARAMVGDPDILIADEPIAGLDPRHALDAMRRLKALGAKGRLVIVALHDLSLATQFADRLVALRDGRIVADGAPADIVTPDLLRRLFDVEARVERDGNGVAIRFLGAA
jgi:iron complex transport system ATP-binding protein